MKLHIKDFFLTAAVIVSLMCISACSSPNDTSHKHTLVHTEMKAATCTENGNIEYWTCHECQKSFLDAQATTEVESVIIPAAHTGGTEIRNYLAATEYEDGYSGDTYCLGCRGEISRGNVLPHTSTAPAVIISGATVEENTVKVVISVVNNPGIASLKFNVLYDEMLSIQEIEFSEAFGAYITSPKPYINPQTVNWMNPSANTTVDGEFMTITFSVSPTAGTSAEIRIILDGDNIFDYDMNRVQFNSVGITLTLNG